MILTSPSEFFLPVSARGLFNSVREERRVSGSRFGSPPPHQSPFCRSPTSASRGEARASAGSSVTILPSHTVRSPSCSRSTIRYGIASLEAQGDFCSTVLMLRSYLSKGGVSLLFHGPLCTVGAGRAILPPLGDFPEIVFRD